MNLWTYKEYIRLSLALGYLAVLISFNAWMSFAFWLWLFSVVWLAVLIIALAEVLGYLAFVLHVARIQTPVNALRYTAAATSSLGVATGLQQLAQPQIGAVVAWIVALVGLAVATAITQLFLNEIAALFDDPVERRKAFTKATLKKLAVADVQHKIETQWSGEDIPSPLAWLGGNETVLAVTKASNGIDMDMPFERRNGHAHMGFSPVQKAAVIVAGHCPKCHAPLDAARLGAARRYGHCAACKGKQEGGSE